MAGFVGVFSLTGPILEMSKAGLKYGYCALNVSMWDGKYGNCRFGNPMVLFKADGNGPLGFLLGLYL